jgi:lysophospholipase L1-like esterase
VTPGEVRIRIQPVIAVVIVLTIAGSVAIAIGAVTLAQRFYAAAATVRLVPVAVNSFAEENARLKAKNSRRVVFFGDSRIELWYPKPELTGSEVVFRGIGGETTSQMRYRFDADVVQLKPDIVIIQAGINDLVAGATLRRDAAARDLLLANVRYMIDAARTGNVEVILMTVIRPSKPELSRAFFWHDDIYHSVSEVNASIHEMFDSMVTVFDADALLRRGEDRLPALYAKNTLHFTTDAYVALNTQLSEVLERHLNAVQ